MFKLALMILVYPVGITALYSYELWKNREAIQDSENSDNNPNIQCIVFLWRDYRPDFWWFEIYECFRRLNFTGVLLFFSPGSPGQLCFSLILALTGSLVYAYSQPFMKVEDNTLAQTSSVSFFLTLLAAIMVQLKSSLNDIANSYAFGILLIAVNILIFIMFAVGLLYKPLFCVIKKLNAKHYHDAPLKEMGPEVAYSVGLFVEHFKKLAESDMNEAGWTELDVKDWSGKKKTKEWREETGAKVEWRCAKGGGPIDQARRDLVYTEHTRREQGGDVLVCSRSSKELSDSTNEPSLEAGRMRADLKVGGYRLRGVEWGKTEVVCLVGMDLGGSFAIGYLHRRMAQSYLKGVVDMHRKFAEKIARGGAVSEPPPPLPILSKALAAAAKKGGAKGKRLTTNPMFAGLRNTDSSADDSVNIELGRMIKKSASKGDEGDENDIVVL
ncbi:hypothetical protein TL16_g06590 [Triparma laevis f. inornata]|uniref:START domain-containing protein n=1 Tax=Triparma laevis f. inornata TaxID=1714386 RepID=A0A9W7EDJ2_9STRA|nr:hypothetical protein TL16_g06590 [Triparma laevis f. inornata]